jgi:hypothetical protein
MPVWVLFAAVGAVVLAALVGLVAGWIPRPAWLSTPVAVCILVVLIVASGSLAVVTATSQADAGPDVRIGQPLKNTEVGYPADLSGRLAEPLAAGHTLWAVQRSVDESRYHPQDQACTIVGSGWECPSIYLGAPEQVGVRFQIIILDADASAAQELIDYGQRDHSAPDAFRGLDELPHGAQTVASVRVRRA